MKMIAIPLALMLASAPVVALQSSAAYAQDMSQGADNFYKSDRVTIEKVTFRNKLGMKVVGNLFVPKNLDRSARTPAIIVGHPMGAVKEQSSNLYAQKLAEQGFVTLSFDLSFWGESEGQPRHTVAPEIYADDFSAAVDFLSRKPVRQQGQYRRARHLRERQLRIERRADRPAHEGHRNRQYVRYGCCVP